MMRLLKERLEAMKKFLLAGVVIISASTAAMAADLAPPAPMVYDWTGGYFGLNAGAAWNNSSIDVNDISVAPILPSGFISSIDGNQTAFTGGAEMGYNWQMDSLVMGLETDFNYLGFSTEQSFGTGVPLTPSARFDLEANWFGTVRGRLGFAADNMLFYGTGGLAYGNVKASGRIDDGASNVLSANNSNVNWGWTVGAGMEYAFNENWILGAEYLYVDLGHPDFGLSCNTAACDNVSGNVTAAFSVARAKLDFKFY
jgi:outer membrane immunogenic protein